MISLLLKRTLKTNFREQWNLLTGNDGEKVKFSRDQGNLLPPWEGLTECTVAANA